MESFLLTIYPFQFMQIFMIIIHIIQKVKVTTLAKPLAKKLKLHTLECKHYTDRVGTLAIFTIKNEFT